MGWLKDKIDSFVASYISNFFWNTKWATKQALKSCETTACADKIWAGLDAERREDPEIAALYEDAKVRGEQNKDLGIFGSMPNALFEGFSKLRETIESEIGTTLESVLVPGSPEITQVYEKFADSLLDEFLDLMDPTKSVLTPELRGDIKTTMKPALNLGLTFTVGTALAELIMPTKELGFGRISHFLYDTVGFKALMPAYIDPVMLNLITQPTKYNINKLTTPFIPPWRDALDWYGRGHIDEAEMNSLRTQHGIENGWDYRYQRMGTKASSYFMLNAIAREGFWDVDDFRFWLSDAGYGAFHITADLLTPYEKKYKLKPPRSTQIDFLLDAYKQMNLRSTVGDVRSIRRKLMIDGWISRADFEADLATYKITKADAKDVLDAIEMQQERKDAKELQRAFEKKFTYGRITSEELKVELTKLKLREDYIDARVVYLLTIKEGKLAIEEEVEKDLTNAQILNAWESGVKDKGWALKRIDDKGYTTEDAVTIIDIEEKDQIEDVNDEWIRTYEQRTRNLRMTPAKLEKKLVEHGKKPEWAKARAAYFEEIVLGKEEVI